jgi:hypothetical protein
MPSHYVEAKSVRNIILATFPDYKRRTVRVEVA